MTGTHAAGREFSVNTIKTLCYDDDDESFSVVAVFRLNCILHWA